MGYAIPHVPPIPEGEVQELVQQVAVVAPTRNMRIDGPLYGDPIE